MNFTAGNEYTTKMKQGYLHTIVIGRVGILVYSNPTPLQKSQTGSGDFLIKFVQKGLLLTVIILFTQHY
jgi:hypothetical protein